jgi:hypothetical protein
LELRFCPMVAVFKAMGVGAYEIRKRQANNGSGGGG